MSQEQAQCPYCGRKAALRAFTENSPHWCKDTKQCEARRRAALKRLIGPTA